MTYNMTELQAAETVSDLAFYANSSVDGVLFGFFSIAIFFVILMALKRWDFEDALLTASFLSFMISGIAAFGGFIHIIFPLAYLVMTAFAGLWVYITKR